MKLEFKLWMILLILVIWSCGPKPHQVHTTSASDEAAAQFQTAENLFRAKSYQDALIAYQVYLSRFSKSASADFALMRLTEIYAMQRNDNAMLEAFQRLVAQYPDSRFVADALVAILGIYYKEGEFLAVVRKARQAIEITDSRAHLCQINAILGDAYMALGSTVNAILSYINALQFPDHCEAHVLLTKFETAVGRIGEEDVQALLRIGDEFPKDLLLYRLALIAYNEENFEEAANLLSEFIQTYPNHEKASQAQGLIEEIHQSTNVDPHLVGCLLPLSGPYENFGKRALRAIELARKHHHVRSGRSQLRILVKDTLSDPDHAIEALEQLDEERVAIIIGPIATSEAVARESQKKRIPIITLTQKPDIVEIGDYVFRNFLTPEMQMDTIVPFAIQKLGVKRFAILYPDENYGHTFMKVFRDKVLNSGAKITGIESYHPEQTDFAGPISKLANLKLKDWKTKRRYKKYKRFRPVVGFDAIFIPDSPQKTGLIAPQLAYYDVDKVLLLGTNLWHSNELIKEAGEYVQFALMADGYFADTSKENVHDFMVTFMKQFGEPPGIIEAFAYDTAMIAFQTVDHPRIRSRHEFKKILQHLHNFDGVTGMTSFNENGEADKKLYLLQIDGDKFVEVSGD